MKTIYIRHLLKMIDIKKKNIRNIAHFLFLNVLSTNHIVVLIMIIHESWLLKFLIYMKYCNDRNQKKNMYTTSTSIIIVIIIESYQINRQTNMINMCYMPINVCMCVCVYVFFWIKHRHQGNRDDQFVIFFFSITAIRRYIESSSLLCIHQFYADFFLIIIIGKKHRQHAHIFLSIGPKEKKILLNFTWCFHSIKFDLMDLSLKSSYSIDNNFVQIIINCFF